MKKTEKKTTSDKNRAKKKKTENTLNNMSSYGWWNNVIQYDCKLPEQHSNFMRYNTRFYYLIRFFKHMTVC